MKFLKQIYLNRSFFRILLGISALFLLGYHLSFLLVIARILLFIYIALVITELFLIFQGRILCEREVNHHLSNGDANTVLLKLQNRYGFKVRAKIIDELPPQLQKRDFYLSLTMKPGEKAEKTYTIIPYSRGIYSFGFTRIFVNVLSGSISRRFSGSVPQDASVYPSYMQLRKTELIAFASHRNIAGTKKIRQAGNSKEFEEIKDYTPGDNYRWINWKATARRSKLMVNQYQDERSRDVYQIIDMGRTMKMPFEGLTLLDYAINSTLAISNVILKKHDRTGLATFSNKIHSFVKADNKPKHLNKILETLYAQQTDYKESNLEQVFLQLSRNTQGRSLIILYTNFESALALDRYLPILKRLAANHLIVLVSFINTEVQKTAMMKAESVEEIYAKTLAGKTILEKQIFMKKLSRYGIHNLTVKPSELTISVLNKYLDIKRKGF